MFFSELPPETFHYNPPMEIRFDGKTASAATNYGAIDYLHGNKYFLQLQGLLSFFPHLTARGERTIKLHLAAYFRHSQLDKDLQDLKTTFASLYNPSGGYVANDNFASECSFIDRNSDLYVPFENSVHLNYRFVPYLPYGFEEQNFTNLQLYRSRALNFHGSCFEPDEGNTIRIGGSPSTSSHSDFKSDASAVEIRFGFAKELSHQHELVFGQPYNVVIPYLYKITTNYRNEIQIRPLIKEKLIFSSQIKPEYADSLSPTSLGTLAVHPFFVNPEDRREFFLVGTLFPYAYLQNDFDLMRQGTKFKFEMLNTVLQNQFEQSVEIPGFLWLESDVIEEYAFTPGDNFRLYGRGDSLFLPYKNYFYRQSFLKGARGNVLTKDGELLPAKNWVLLGNGNNPLENIQIQHLLKLNSIGNYQFTLLQSTSLENRFFRKLSVVIENILPTSETEDEELAPSFVESYVGLVPFTAMREMLFQSVFELLSNSEGKREIMVFKK